MLGFDISTRTNRFLKLFGCLKATMGGSGRGYKQNIIKKSFNKANNISRSSLLQYKEQQKCKRTPCVLTYHPCLKNSFNTIRGHWTSVEKNSPSFQIIFKLTQSFFKDLSVEQIRLILRA
jgi:hypothetical protein